MMICRQGYVSNCIYNVLLEMFFVSCFQCHSTSTFRLVPHSSLGKFLFHLLLQSSCLGSGSFIPGARGLYERPFRVCFLHPPAMRQIANLHLRRSYSLRCSSCSRSLYNCICGETNSREKFSSRCFRDGTCEQEYLGRVLNAPFLSKLRCELKYRELISFFGR